MIAHLFNVYRHTCSQIVLKNTHFMFKMDKDDKYFKEFYPNFFTVYNPVTKRINSI